VKENPFDFKILESVKKCFRMNKDDNRTKPKSGKRRKGREFRQSFRRKV